MLQENCKGADLAGEKKLIAKILVDVCESDRGVVIIQLCCTSPIKYSCFDHAEKKRLGKWKIFDINVRERLMKKKKD